MGLLLNEKKLAPAPPLHRPRPPRPPRPPPPPPPPPQFGNHLNRSTVEKHIAYQPAQPSPPPTPLPPIWKAFKIDLL